jgi:hypothetical protein
VPSKSLRNAAIEIPFRFYPFFIIRTFRRYFHRFQGLEKEAYRTHLALERKAAGGLKGRLPAA